MPASIPTIESYASDSGGVTERIDALNVEDQNEVDPPIYDSSGDEEDKRELPHAFESHEIKKWKAIETWDGLIRKNVDIITLGAKGELVESPYGEVLACPRNKELVPGFLRLHSYGMFIMGSQPYVPLETFHGRDYWYEAIQYPMVEFLLPHEGESTEAFIRNLKSDTQLKPKMYDNRSGVARLIDGSFPDRVNFTRYREATSKDGLSRAEWKVEAAAPKKVLDLRDEYVAEVKAVKSKQPLWFIVCSLEDIDLLGRIDKLALESGLKAEYGQRLIT